jgi:Zn-dependent membrane protease YugP
MVTTQLAVPLQPLPLQPVKVDEASAVALRVTMVPAVNEAAQVAPQLIPAGALLTVPLPLPLLVTLSR